jgi:hypothetical protein
VLSLTGTNTNGITVTDSAGLLSGNPMPANQGQFTDQIMVTLPTGSKFSDTLSMTGTNSETENSGSPATADTTISQTITADTETTLEDVADTIPISNLGLGSGMKVTAVAPGPLGPQFGTVSVGGDGQSLTYTPTTLDDFVNGVATNDQDVFQVYSSDGAGHTAVTLLTVKETPVADAPTVSIQLLPYQNGDPINEVRLEITGTSADFGGVNNGSDFIQSIGLGGTAVNDTSQILVNGQLLTGDTINESSNTGFVSDEVDLFMNTPVNATLNDTLAVTSTAAETDGSTPAISAPQTQSIVIENTQTNQDLTFSTSKQSMWTTGTAPFTTNYATEFKGLDVSKSTSKHLKVPIIGAPIAGGTASAHLRVGFQASLDITSGDFSATLPFTIGLDSTYNKTNDTSQIDWTDAQLGGGKFSAQFTKLLANVRARFRCQSYGACDDCRYLRCAKGSEKSKCGIIHQASAWL